MFMSTAPVTFLDLEHEHTGVALPRISLLRRFSVQLQFASDATQLSSSPVMQNVTRTASQIYAIRLRSFLLLYFLQGLPYGIQTRFLPFQLRKVGMSLTNLGYFRMTLAPWVLKGLWAPIIDRAGDLRLFVSGSHIVLVILAFIAAHFPPENITVLSVVLFLIHLAVAVQDIALDGLLIELLTPSQLVAGNMVQVAGYKLGSIVSGGFFGFFAEIAGWDTLFYILALMYGAGYVISEFGIPEDNEDADIRSFILDRRVSTNNVDEDSRNDISGHHAPTDNVKKDLRGGISGHRVPTDNVDEDSRSDMSGPHVPTDNVDEDSRSGISGPRVPTDNVDEDSRSGISGPRVPTDNVDEDSRSDKSGSHVPTDNVDEESSGVISGPRVPTDKDEDSRSGISHRRVPKDYVDESSKGGKSHRRVPTDNVSESSNGGISHRRVRTDNEDEDDWSGFPINNTVSSIAGFDDTNSAPIQFTLGQRRRQLRQSIYELVDIEGTMWLLPFVFLYKFGDQGVSTLFPMFMIDAGIDVAEVTFWTGFVGQLFSLVGCMLGGMLRKTMIESIQILLVVQAVCLLCLWAVVIYWNNSRMLYYGSMFVLMLANMASGGVTTCTFTLIMQLSQKVPRRFRTSHYTLLATSEVAGRLVASSITGLLTDSTSYSFVFGLLVGSSVVILPSLLVVPEVLIIKS
ncbi:hypothetical protein BsWGS_00198 [Bradybaena similaris]